jgi:hypothetical protein
MAPVVVLFLIHEHVKVTPLVAITLWPTMMVMTAALLESKAGCCARSVCFSMLLLWFDGLRYGGHLLKAQNAKGKCLARQRLTHLEGAFGPG